MLTLLFSENILYISAPYLQFISSPRLNFTVILYLSNGISKLEHFDINGVRGDVGFALYTSCQTSMAHSSLQFPHLKYLSIGSIHFDQLLTNLVFKNFFSNAPAIEFLSLSDNNLGHILKGGALLDSKKNLMHLLLSSNYNINSFDCLISTLNTLTNLTYMD